MDRNAIPLLERERLAALHRYGLLDSEPEEAFDGIAELARMLCCTPMSTVTLVDANRQWFKAERGVGITGSSRDDSLCTHAIQQNTPLIIEDTLLDPRSAQNVFVTRPPHLRFYAGAPLTTSDGYNVGTLCVFDIVPRQLSAAQIAGLETLARQTVAQMDLRLRLRERELQAQAVRTAEKLAVVGRMASSMAHEINNPLQSVTNLLFMAHMQSEGEAKRYVAEAQDELARVTHIVTQTLRFHQQSQGPKPVRLGEIVESVVALFRTRVRHASAEIVIKDSQTELLTCYASDLRQVLANLLANALDAVSHAPGGTICFRIRDARHPATGAGGLRLTVSDDGEGMSAESKARLFEPFFSTKGARGTGLGLWVSRGILEKHGAAVHVRSSTARKQHGTVFTIFFPLEFPLAKTGAVGIS